MDSLLNQLIANAPWAALLAYMLYIVYRDARIDRQQAAAERQAMLEKLEALDKSLNSLTNAIENWTTMQKIRQKRNDSKAKQGF